MVGKVKWCVESKALSIFMHYMFRGSFSSLPALSIREIVQCWERTLQPKEGAPRAFSIRMSFQELSREYEF